MALRGRAHVLRSLIQFEATVSRSQKMVDPFNASDYARLLVVLLSGMLEASVAELTMERARRESYGVAKTYLVTVLERTPNPTADAIRNMLGKFDPSWGEMWDQFLTPARKEAVNSVVGLRNNIAHGRNAAPSLGSVIGYYASVREVIVWLTDLIDPIN